VPETYYNMNKAEQYALGAKKIVDKMMRPGPVGMGGGGGVLYDSILVPVFYV